MADVTVTVNSGGGADYTTIQAAIDDADVATGFYKVEIENSALYQENLNVGGATGTPTIANYLWLTATDGAYHAGVVGSGARVQGNTSDHTIEITDDFVRIEKLQVLLDSSANNSEECIRIINDGDILIERCILDAQARVNTVNDGDCLYCDDDTATPITVYNCVLIDADRAWFDMYQYDGTINFEFCTGYRCAVTETQSSDRHGYLIPRATGSPTWNCYNNVGDGNVYTIANGLSFSQACFRAHGVGPFTINGSHNATQDEAIGTSAPAANLQAEIITADVFTDAANYDLTIKDTNSVLYQNGTDRSGSKPDSRVDATIDIRGITRPATPSIGAYEFPAAGPDRSITAAQDAFLPTQSAAAAVRNDITAAQDAFLPTQAATATVLADVTAAQDAFLPTQSAALVGAETRTITGAQDAFLATQSAAATVLADIAAAQGAFLPTQAATSSVLVQATAAQDAFLATQAASLAVRADLTADQFGFLATQSATLALGDTRTVAAAQDAFLATQAAAATVLVQATAAQDAFLATQAATATVRNDVAAAQDAFLPTQSAALEVRAELTAAQDAFLATQQGSLVQGDVRVITGAQAAFLATQQASLTVRLELNAAQDAFLATQSASATVLASSTAAQSAFLPTQAGTLELLAQVTAAQNAFLATQSALLTPVAPGITATQTAFLPTQQGTLVVRSEIAANQSAFLPTQASQIQHVSFLTSAQAAFLPTQSALVIRGTLPATSLQGVANVEAALAGRFDPIIDLEGRTIS